MSHSKHDVRTPAGIDHPGSVGRLERKWLFAEYRFAGARCGDDLIGVQRMRRCQNDRPHFRVGERICIVRAERKVVLGGEITRFSVASQFVGFRSAKARPFAESVSFF